MLTAPRHLGLSFSVLLAGCGLTLDYAPPDPQPRLDGGRMDAGRADAGGREDGGTDGGVSDAGTPGECVEDVDCDDGEACTGLEQCVDGACVAGEPIACPDEDVCDGVDVCVDGECVPGPVMTCPSDSNPCNGTEICDPVVGCTTLPPEPCEDGVECTRDTCDVFEGCRHQPDESLCPEGPGRRCDSVAGCQYDVCDAATCVPTGCTDAHCVSDSCVYSSLCDFAPFCCAGTCVMPGCDDGNPCTADSCDPATGCRNEPVAVGTTCDDRDRCTVGETCSSTGACSGGTGRSCADGDPCTLDACDPSAGCVRTSAADGTACTDGDACTTPDRCVSGACMPGMTRPCSFGTDSPCLVARCDAALGCVQDPVAAGRPCLDGSGTCDGAGHCCGSNTDCDGDGICECPAGTTCGFAGGCPGSDCAGDADCSIGEACCRGGTATRLGYCFPRTCLGCCAAVAL